MVYINNDGSVTASAANLAGMGAVSAGDVLGTLAWIYAQSQIMMALTNGSDGSDDDLSMLNSMASDIAINTELLANKLDPAPFAKDG